MTGAPGGATPAQSSTLPEGTPKPLLPAFAGSHVTRFIAPVPREYHARHRVEYLSF